MVAFAVVPGQQSHASPWTFHLPGWALPFHVRDGDLPRLSQANPGPQGCSPAHLSPAPPAHLSTCDPESLSLNLGPSLAWPWWTRKRLKPLPHGQLLPSFCQENPGPGGSGPSTTFADLTAPRPGQPATSQPGMAQPPQVTSDPQVLPSCPPASVSPYSQPHWCGAS